LISNSSVNKYPSRTIAIWTQSLYLIAVKFVAESEGLLILELSLEVEERCICWKPA